MANNLRITQLKFIISFILNKFKILSKMFDRRKTISESSILGELYSGENFDVNKHFNDSLSGLNFNFNLNFKYL